MSKIKVKTEVLTAKASSLQGRTAEMRAQFDSLEAIVNRTSNYWIGEAGDKERNEYQSKKDRIEELFKRLNEYPKDLFQMAGVYEQAESASTNISEGLSSEVII